MKQLLDCIADADEVEVDACWSILKYVSIGIRRKLLCMALIFGLETGEVLDSAPKDQDGRILDKSARTAIHDILIKRSKELLKNEN